MSSPVSRPLLSRTFAALALVTGAITMPAQALEPFSADYEANYMGVSATGQMRIEPQGSNQWKCTLKIENKLAQLRQTTIFEDRDGDWRPLTGTDASLLLVEKIRRNAVYDWAAGEARWSGDVKPERAGPVELQAGDVDGLLLNLAIARDALAGKPLQYRMVGEGRATQMSFLNDGRETITIAGKPREATRLVASGGNKQILIWVVEGLAVPARILHRRDGKDEFDLRISDVR